MGKKKSHKKSQGYRKITKQRKNEKVWVWIALSIILVFGFCLRLTFVFTAYKIPFNLLSDSSQYYHWANNILLGKEFKEVYHQGPLYPFFLYLVFSLFGLSILHALVVQAVLGTVTCFLVYWLSLKIFKKEWIGIVAALVMAAYTPAIFYNGMLLMATLVTLIDLVFLLILLKALEMNKIWIWGIAGLILGASALAWGTILLFIPILIIFIIWKVWKEYRSKKCDSKIPIISFFMLRCIYPILVFLIGTSLMILPVTLRNYIKGKDSVLIAANFGITLFEGNNPWATGQYMDPPGLDLSSDFNGGKIAQYIEKRSLRPSEISRFWLKRSWQFIRDNPWLYVKLLVKKLVYFWNRYEIPNAENLYFARQYSKVLQVPLFNFLIVGALGLLGIIISIIKRIPNASIVILFLLSHMIAMVLFFVTARYRIPIVPILIIFMAFSIFTVGNEIRDKKYRNVLLWAIVGILSFVFVAFPWSDLNYKQDYASSYDNIGVLFHLTGNYQQALRYYQMAIKCDPTYIKTYNNIGGLYYMLGRKPEAIEYWKKGLEKNPNSGLIHMNLGNIYLKDGQIEKAREEYAIAAHYMPYSIKIKEIEDKLGLAQK